MSKEKSGRKEIIRNYRSDAIESFRNYKMMAERAIEQVSDEEFFGTIDSEANSIALIVKHISGNLRSRWTDFLTSDGEKPDRHRDLEFEIVADTRQSLMEYWESSWAILFDALEPLKARDFGRNVSIRREPYTVVEAINRQLTHYAYHIGQIVLLAKHYHASDWNTLSIPKNRSAEFNQFLAEKKTEGTEKSNRFETARKFSDDEANSSGRGRS